MQEERQGSLEISSKAAISETYSRNAAKWSITRALESCRPAVLHKCFEALLRGAVVAVAGGDYIKVKIINRLRLCLGGALGLNNPALLQSTFTCSLFIPRVEYC